MRLSIRWKFILSIGLTLLVTYLGLLTWDYGWQRETAALQMQDLATARAQGLANALNEVLSTAARQADTLAAAIQNRPPANIEQLEQVLRESRPSGNMLVVWRWETEVGGERRNETAFEVISGPDGRGFFGGRGGRGQGPGQGPGRGPPPDGMTPPPDAGNQEGRGPRGFEPPPERSAGPGARQGRSGRFGPGRGAPPTRVVTVDNDARRRDLVVLLNRTSQGGWQGPRANDDLGPGLFTYTVPITINENSRGLIVSRVTVEELEALVPASRNRGRGRGPSTAPATQTASAFGSDAITILDEQGRRLLPPEPRRGPQSRDPSPLEQAQQAGNTELAGHIQAALAGEHRVVNVSGATGLIPTPVAGESYWVALAPVPASEWVVTAGIPESQFMSRIVQRLWERGLFLMAGLALLLAITTFISIRMTQPIERMASAVKQLAAGNLDAQVTGVESRDELGQLARAFNMMTGQLKQHIAALTEQTAASQSVEAELRIARQIQSDLLPRRFPPFPDRKEFELHAINVAAKRVAGDFYDFFFAPNGMLTITIADVAGKGMPAALLMAVTRTIIRNLAMEGHSPAQIIERANALLVQDITNSMFVTLFLLQYDTRTGRIMYVNAGHPHPYRFGANGSPHHFGEVTGAILGVNPNGGDWAFEEREEQLRVGETLLLYTDGVTEARAPDASMLRDAGLEKLIVKYGGEDVKTICDKFVEEVSRFQNGHQADDITLLALRRTR